LPVPPALSPLSLHDALPISSFVRPCAKLLAQWFSSKLPCTISPLVWWIVAVWRSSLKPPCCSPWYPPLTQLSTIWCVLSNFVVRSEEHTSELQSRFDLVCRL